MSILRTRYGNECRSCAGQAEARHPWHGWYVYTSMSSLPLPSKRDMSTVFVDFDLSIRVSVPTCPKATTGGRTGGGGLLNLVSLQNFTRPSDRSPVRTVHDLADHSGQMICMICANCMICVICMIYLAHDAGWEPYHLRELEQ